MNAYLLTWNSKEENWDTFQSDLKSVRKKGYCVMRWSCGNSKSLSVGDRVFMMKLGKTKIKGLMGSGYIVKGPWRGVRWDDPSKKTNYVEVEFNTLLDPSSEKLLTQDVLQKGKLAKQNWIPQSSGISIKDEVLNALEQQWLNLNGKIDISLVKYKQTGKFDGKKFLEGKTTEIKQTRYERSSLARRACINHYGPICDVCEFDFKRTYGSIGEGFIHVHHIQLLSKSKFRKETDHIRDLRPVCPNCHAMIHRTKNPLSIEVLKRRIKDLKRRNRKS